MSFTPDKEEIDDACARGDVGTLRSMLETVEAERLVLQARQLAPNASVVRSLLCGSPDACRKTMFPENSPIGFWVDAEIGDKKVFVTVEQVLRWAQLETQPTFRSLDPSIIVEALTLLVLLPPTQVFEVLRALGTQVPLTASTDHSRSQEGSYSLTLTFLLMRERKK